jgi:NAD(P)-dependent dehydrogenase (short-subunit alcohol dehydrogenase family)
MTSTQKLKDKVAIVTGSARGIGKAIAIKFASEGASVVVTDILIEQARNVADEIKDLGGMAIAIKADVTSRSDIQNLVKETLDNFKAIHILMNDAAITRHAPLLEITEEEWDAVIDVDLKGVFNCTQAVLGHMMEQQYGKIVNIASAAGGFNFSGGMANYASAKAGVIQLTINTAVEAGRYGINVNAILPGSVPTDITYSRRDKDEVERHVEMRKRLTVLGRNGKPEDIANLAFFLAPEDSSFITGQFIRCDGGLISLIQIN